MKDAAVRPAKRHRLEMRVSPEQEALIRHAAELEGRTITTFVLKTDVARTFVLVDGEAVLGYFSLTMGSVHRAVAPPALVRGLPGYPVGMVLLARLAVDAHAQGQSLGALLLAEALRRAVAAGEAAAARLVVVDAVDEAAARFYLHHGFVFVPEHPLRLYRRMKDVRASQ